MLRLKRRIVIILDIATARCDTNQDNSGIFRSILYVLRMLHKLE